MTHPFDLKAIGQGVAVFVLGYLVLSVLATIAAGAENSTVHRVLWGIVQLGGVVIPGVAGYVAAYRASTRPIFQGTIAGSVGIAVLTCVVAFTFPQYPAWGIPLVVAFFALVAALWAIFGKHRRAKLG